MVQNMDRRRRIAIIGGGISGLSAAWFLRNHASVTLFEADARIGGHTHTYLVDEGTREVAVDTGFMVFNRPNYPLLSRLFQHLGIETYPTNMSFSVSLDRGRQEYAGSNLKALFAQRSNLVNPRFLHMLSEILRFNRLVKALIDEPQSGAEALGAWLHRNRLGRRFREHYLYPMAAAIWSCPRDAVAEFPVSSFAHFFANHGLVDLFNRPQWETVVDGASSYVDRMLADLGGRVRAGTSVFAVRRHADRVELVSGPGAVESFDEVVFACHSDQALRILVDATASERRLLSSVPYQDNRVLLHRDPRLMPSRRAVWSSWNYSAETTEPGGGSVSVSYWMNSLQRLDSKHDYFVSLNPLEEPQASQVVAEFNYQHPVFGAESLQLQSLLARMQGRDRVWFSGAWTGYGFHEDGIRSGADVAAALGAQMPWDASLADSRALIEVSTRWEARAA